MIDKIDEQSLSLCLSLVTALLHLIENDFQEIVACFRSSGRKATQAWGRTHKLHSVKTQFTISWAADDNSQV